MNASWPALTPLLFILVFVGLIAVGIRAAIAEGRRRAANLRRVAETLGLAFSVDPAALGAFVPMPRVEGEVRGRRVRFFEYSTGSGKHRQRWCALGVACQNPDSLSLQLHAAGLFSRLGEMLGAQDVRVGDATFDARFVVKSNAPDFIAAGLLPELRERLLALWPAGEALARIRLEGGELVFATSGSFGDAGKVDRAERLLPVLHDLATLPEVYARA